MRQSLITIFGSNAASFLHYKINGTRYSIRLLCVRRSGKVPIFEQAGNDPMRLEMRSINPYLAIVACYF